MAELETETSVIGSATRIIGRVSGKGDLRIEGHVYGDVVMTGATHVESGALVEGNVEAGSLEVRGTLEGDAVANGLVLIASGAQVTGELRGSEITIEEGSRVAVRLDTELELSLSF